MIAYHHFINRTPERAGRFSLWLQQDSRPVDADTHARWTAA